MIDIEYFDKVLSAPKPKRIIEWNEHFDKSTLVWLSQHKQSEYDIFFNRIEPGGTNSYSFDWECDNCGKDVTERFASKTRLNEVISHIRGNKKRDTIEILCRECTQIKAKKRNEERKEYDTWIESKTNNFIHNFLDPHRDWDEGLSNKEKWHLIANSSVDRFKVSQAIKQLVYKDFLMTPYWKAVAWKVRANFSFQCAICGGKKPLQVHHRTYDLHGVEHTWDGLKELIAICSDCHRKHHFE